MSMHGLVDYACKTLADLWPGFFLPSIGFLATPHSFHLSPISNALTFAMSCDAGGVIAYLVIGAVGTLAVIGLARCIPLCRVKHAMPPFPAPVDGPVKATHFQSNTTGLLVHHRTWPITSGTSPSAICFIVHGYGEHGGRYTEFITKLSATGIMCYTLDHQGHGQSEGDRGYFDSVQDLAADVRQWVSLMRERDAGSVWPADTPQFIYGHSMGGLTAFHAAAGQQDWTGVLLTGPAFKPDPKVASPLNVWLAKTFASLLPKLGVEALNPMAVSRRAEVVWHYKRDSLNFHGKMCPRVGYALLQAMDLVPSIATSWTTVPLYVAQGAEDQLVNVDGAREMVKCVATTDVTYREVPGAYHELLNDVPEVADAISADMLEWIQGKAEEATAGRAAGSGGPNAASEQAGDAKPARRRSTGSHTAVQLQEAGSAEGQAREPVGTDD